MILADPRQHHQAPARRPCLWTWGVFLVTLFLLSKIAWPMLLKKMEERELHISEGLKKAEEAEAACPRARGAPGAAQRRGSQGGAAVLPRRRQMAENQRNELLAAAQEEIAAERERAKKEIGLERARGDRGAEGDHGRAHPRGVVSPLGRELATRTTSASRRTPSTSCSPVRWPRRSIACEHLASRRPHLRQGAVRHRRRR